MRPNSSSRWLALALALTALTYAAALRYDFLLDDVPQILNNPLVHSWRNLPGFFLHHTWAQVQGAPPGNYYRPLFLAWLLLNFKLYGLHAAAWHATTLLLHLLATGLAWLIARRLLETALAAGLVALVFGLHPVHLESVAWISGLSDPLYSVPFLASFLFYLRSRRGRGIAGGASADLRTSPRANLALSLLFYALALLAKEPAVVLPVVLFAYQFLHDPRRSSDAADLPPTRPALAFSALLSVLPYLVLTAAYLVVRLLALRGFSHPMTGVSPAVELLTAPSLLVFYLRHLLWPAGIAQYYQQEYVTRLSAGFFLPGALLLLVLAALLYWTRRSRNPGVLVAALWLLLPLLPTLKIDTYLYGELVHDRYLYLPVFGFALLLALALEQLARLAPFAPHPIIPRGAAPSPGHEAAQPGDPSPGATPHRETPLPLTLAVLLLSAAYAAATAVQSTQWSSHLALFTRAVQVSPNNAHAVALLAQELLTAGRFDDAVPVLQRAVQLAPSDPTGWFLLGHNFYRLRRFAESEAALARAAQLAPNGAAIHYFLGLARVELGRPADAEPPLRHALALMPNAHGVHQALGAILAARGDLAAARAEFESELRLDPTNAAARAALARLPR